VNDYSPPFEKYGSKSRKVKKIEGSLTRLAEIYLSLDHSFIPVCGLAKKCNIGLCKKI